MFEPTYRTDLRIFQDIGNGQFVRQSFLHHIVKIRQIRCSQFFKKCRRRQPCILQSCCVCWSEVFFPCTCDTMTHLLGVVMIIFFFPSVHQGFVVKLANNYSFTLFICSATQSNVHGCKMIFLLGYIQPG